MSNADQAPEPTMDEILASIRRIISDEPTQVAEQKPEGAENSVANDIARALSDNKPPVEGMDDDILELTAENQIAENQIIENPEASLVPEMPAEGGFGSTEVEQPVIEQNDQELLSAHASEHLPEASAEPLLEPSIPALGTDQYFTGEEPAFEGNNHAAENVFDAPEHVVDLKPEEHHPTNEHAAHFNSVVSEHTQIPENELLGAPSDNEASKAFDEILQGDDPQAFLGDDPMTANAESLIDVHNETFTSLGDLSAAEHLAQEIARDPSIEDVGLSNASQPDAPIDQSTEIISDLENALEQMIPENALPSEHTELSAESLLQAAETVTETETEALLEVVMDPPGEGNDEVEINQKEIVDSDLSSLEELQSLPEEILPVDSPSDDQDSDEDVKSELKEEKVEDMDLTETASHEEDTEELNTAVAIAKAAVEDNTSESQASEGTLLPEKASNKEVVEANPAKNLAQSPLEESIKDMLKPMLREWLDDNMPRLLEGAMKEQSQRKDKD